VCSTVPTSMGLLTYLLTYMAWVRAQAPQRGAKHGSWGFTIKVYIRVNIKELLRVHIKEVLRVLINHITGLIRHFTVSKQKLIRWILPPALGAFKQKRRHLDRVLVHEPTELLGRHGLICNLLPTAQLIKQVWVALPNGSVTNHHTVQPYASHPPHHSNTAHTPVGPGARRRRPLVYASISVFPPQDHAHIA